MVALESRFRALQHRHSVAFRKVCDLRDSLRRQYGQTWYAPQGKRDRLERAHIAADKAMEAVFRFLDEHSPRNWRNGVSAYWVCEELTYADAVTHGRLSVTPTPAYGYSDSDAERFAEPVPALV